MSDRTFWSSRRFTPAKLAFDIRTKGSRKRVCFFSKTVCLALIALVSVVACQQIWSTNNSANLAYSISTGQKNVAVGGGGYVTGIYLHPKQQDLVYLKTDVGGFYRWNPTNQNWLSLTDRFSLDESNYYGGEALALDPNNPDIVYIAAGKYAADWSSKGAIFKSTDRGNTWSKLNIDLMMGGNEELSWVGERLAINPWDSNTILFGSRLDGLWKSLDAGATWSKVTSFGGNLKRGIGITAVAFDSKVPGLVYAIAYGDGIYQSNDTGVTWSKLSGSPPETKRMAVASNSTLYLTHSSGVSKYVNGSWSNITPFNMRDAFNAISTNPINPNDLLVSPNEKTDGSDIYHSTDGGTTWRKKSKSITSTVPWWTRYMKSNPWISAIAFDPNLAGRVWFTDWYGIWRTENINADPVAWTNYENGHEQIVTFTLVAPPSGPLLLSGVADVDGFYHDKGLDIYPSQKFSARGPKFNDTYHIAYCEANPLKMVRVGGERDRNNTGAISQDGGWTWQRFASFPANKMPTRIAISATDPDNFVVTTSNGQPLVTHDSGRSWTQVSGLPNGFEGPWNWSQPLAADKVDGNTFYYYAEGKVYRSVDRGQSFAVVNTSLPSHGWHTLHTFPGSKGEVWLSLDEQGLYRSTDGGATFSQLDKVERAHLFTFGKPSNGSTVPALYLFGAIKGMGQGIFRSLDRGDTWQFIGDRSVPIGNSPNVMEASKQQFGLVFIGTNGRGIYYIKQ